MNTQFLFKSGIICLLLTVNLTGCIKKAPEEKSGGQVPVVLKGKITSLDKSNVLKDAYIYVYKDNSTDFMDSPFIISGPSDENGEYSITLPSGKYYFIARKFLENKPKVSDLRMNPGEYYCYYGGNPVSVYNNQIFIGFNCSKIAKNETFELMQMKEKTGIKGVITYDDKPLSDAYLLIYSNKDSDFRGPVNILSRPTDNEGNFNIELPPGTYYVLAKKKKNTDVSRFYNVYQEGRNPMGNIAAGPLSQDDYFSYYHNNPVTVNEGTCVNISLAAINKLSSDEITHNNYFTPTKIEGIVKDTAQKPVQGLQVFAFRRRMMGAEKPAFVSNLTGADGKYIIYFNDYGLFYLMARDFVGRTPKYNDTFGYYFGTEDHSIAIKENTALNNIDIIVEKRQ